MRISWGSARRTWLSWRPRRHRGSDASAPLTLGPQAPRSGLLQSGYDADMIALTGDLVTDPSIIADPANVTHVWKAGELVKAPAATS
jgi:hypothetical protein